MADDENRKEELNEEVPVVETEEIRGTPLRTAVEIAMEKLEAAEKVQAEAVEESPAENTAELEDDEEAGPVTLTTNEQPDTHQNDLLTDATQSNYVQCPDTVFSRAMIASMGLRQPPSLQNYNDLCSTLNLKTLVNANGMKIKMLGSEFKEIAKYANETDKENGKTDIENYYRLFCDKEDSDEAAKKRIDFDNSIQNFFQEGFSVETKGGNRITFNHDTETGKSAFTSQSGKKFNQEAAKALIDLATSAGWKNINIAGTPKQKDMLWLEIQKKNLVEEMAFTEAKALGKIPESEVYKPIKCADDSFIPSIKMQKEFDKFKKDATDAFEDRMKGLNSTTDPDTTPRVTQAQKTDLNNDGTTKKAPTAKIK